jgi:hypothetical protein
MLLSACTLFVHSAAAAQERKAGTRLRKPLSSFIRFSDLANTRFIPVASLFCGRMLFKFTAQKVISAVVDSSGIHDGMLNLLLLCPCGVPFASQPKKVILQSLILETHNE